jgi:hypothetical protein
MPVCPAGHDSTTDDYCDVCGARLTAGAPAGAPAGAAPAAAADTPAEPCPDCGAPRSGRFCEQCGHDFTTGAPGAPGADPPPAARWTARVSADRAYYESVRSADGPDEAPVPFPPYSPERTFVLTGQQVRIGRRSTSRGTTPEIDLADPPADPGVSHLHAVLLAQPDGGWALVDPGSTNGTWLNDTAERVDVNVAVPLSPGDRIHLGAWTTITFAGAQGV